MSQTIIITGASSGIGAELAKILANKGYKLGLCARRLENLEAIRADILNDHPNTQVEIAKLDVTQYDDIEPVFNQFKQTLGQIDKILINAGIESAHPIGSGHFDQLKTTIDTNLTAVVAQAECALKIFNEQKQGHLIFTSSMSAFHGLPGRMAIYSATKSAVRSLAQSLASEYYKSPIHISGIHPGYIHTPLTEGNQNMMFPINADKAAQLFAIAIEKKVTSITLPQMPWCLFKPLMSITPTWLFNMILGVPKNKI